MKIKNRINNLTQAELNELLIYDRISGIFKWRLNRGGKIKAGDIAGCLAKNGYIVISIYNRQYKAHRLAWLYENGVMPENDIDHKDRNRSNNKIENLRDVTMQVNAKNKNIDKRNKSGITGVIWHKRNNKWIANIGSKGKLIHLGYFSNEEDAIKARRRAEIKYHYDRKQ